MAVTQNLLREYRERRDFTRTAEPDITDREAQGGEGLLFVVQKHAATRLHYDFRLEWKGVLKSWAVTRGPSLDPGDKRLAVRTEDHPLAYGEFEGVIPEGQYGAGTVMLWDRGTWEPVEDPEKGLRCGKLTFRLNGERLKGEWALVRMAPKPGEKRENWLLIKHREGQAGRRRPADILARHTRSVASGRTMRDIAAAGRTIAPEDVASERRARRPSAKSAVPKAAKGRRGEHALPRWVEPQLATLVEAAPEGGQWLAEMKYDGYRALVAIGRGACRVYTRDGKDWTHRFGEIARAASRLDTSGALIDGEIVAFDDKGRTDFSTLQAALQAGGKGLAFFAFDLLWLDGADIRSRPLVERKDLLHQLLAEAGPPLVYSTHVVGNAPEVNQRLCAAGHEGIVAKRAQDAYRSGRGRSWLKVKCAARQEFVIGGYRPSDKKGRTVASLLIGVNEGGRLVYKGRVGAFEGDHLVRLERLLASRGRKTSPFVELPRDIAREARFVRPDIVVEVGFAEFTREGVVRHGVLKGIREDKPAREVVMETPGATAMQDYEARDVIAGVKLSNPDKVLFAGQGVTKADLAAHYERVAGRILPFVTGRLLSLVRCPEGAGTQCFFQKHGNKTVARQFRRHEITESDGERGIYLYVDDLAGLVAGVQMGTLEFHIWGSRIDRLEQPDRLVFDLDPDEALDFAAVRAAAFDLRERLAALGLTTVPLLTGGKGIHVIAPLARRAAWPTVKAFARAFARHVAAEAPERYVAQAAKAKRTGRIFIDWLRNERGATAIAPYSTRAKKNAPVATPVGWDELTTISSAQAFTIADMEARLSAPDPWADEAELRQTITKAMLGKVNARDED